MVGWKYAKTILNNWLKSGIDSVEKIKAEEINFKNRGNSVNESDEERVARKIKEMEEYQKNVVR